MSNRQSGGEISLTQSRNDARTTLPPPTAASFILATAPGSLHNVRTEASILEEPAKARPVDVPDRPLPAEPEPAVTRPIPQPSSPANGDAASIPDNVAFVVRMSEQRSTEQNAATANPSSPVMRATVDPVARIVKPAESRLAQEMDHGSSPGFTSGERLASPPDQKPASAAVARPMTLPLAAEAPEAMPVRQILLRIDGQGSQAAQVKLSQRGGDVVVSVRGSDPAVVDSLRQALPDLASKLTAHGVNADVWQPSSASSSEAREHDAQRRGAQEQGREGAPSERQQDANSSRERHHRQHRFEDLEELAIELPRRQLK